MDGGAILLGLVRESGRESGIEEGIEGCPEKAFFLKHRHVLTHPSISTHRLWYQSLLKEEDFSLISARYHEGRKAMKATYRWNRQVLYDDTLCYIHDMHAYGSGPIITYNLPASDIPSVH